LANSQHLDESFYDLTPNEVLDAVQEAGFKPTGEYFQLNSYENRVFDIFLEPSESTESFHHRIVTKFYRPNRWTEEALLEEHQFLQDLNHADIPAIAPLKLSNGKTLLNADGIWMCVSPKGLGRLQQEFTLPQYKQIGRMLAQLHNVGQSRAAHHRPKFDAETYAWCNIDTLEEWIAPEVFDRYIDAAETIAEFLEDHLNPEKFIRIHGDCHKGNILMWDKRDEPERFFFVDFDDFVMGPVEQDFWMLLPGDLKQSTEELEALLEGYGDIRTPPKIDLKFYDALRGLRVIHYSAWIARRFDDPTFPTLFPQYEDYLYWAEECEFLEKIAWSLNQ
tara:strand:- start:90989 stop:91990 length:1002 start_codon:yes stop_codon:yes gene_type:complete